MAHPTGESIDGSLRLDFDRRLLLQFRGSTVTSNAGLPVDRALDDVLGFSVIAGEMLADVRTGRNDRHALVGLLRQSVFGLAGYEDVNDAERLRHDPAMRWVVGGKATQCSGASPSQMGRFETRWLSCRMFTANAVRLQLGALAYNLGNFLRTLATPEPFKNWSMATPWEKLIKIGAKVVGHARYVAFQMAEVAVPRTLFADMLRLIAELRPCEQAVCTRPSGNQGRGASR